MKMQWCILHKKIDEIEEKSRSTEAPNKPAPAVSGRSDPDTSAESKATSLKNDLELKKFKVENLIVRLDKLILETPNPTKGTMTEALKIRDGVIPLEDSS